MAPQLNPHSSSAQTRKTHPMVLIAATGLTIFSIIGSAAITGLIPTTNSEHYDQQNVMQNIPDQSTGNFIDKPTLRGEEDSATFGNEDPIKKNNHGACNNCGQIISIKKVTLDAEPASLDSFHNKNRNFLMAAFGINGSDGKDMSATTAYVINVLMKNGNYRTITQYYPPTHQVGEQVKLKSGQLIQA